jgi:hypothetical protein
MRGLVVVVILLVVGVSLIALALGGSFENSEKETEPEPGGDAMILKVDGRALQVEWEDNASVKALSKLAKGTLEISAERYGGFEQVGKIGSSLPRSDKNMTSSPGDVFLYAGDKIVVFFGSNTYSYTKLGSIVGLGQDELKGILDKSGVVFTLTAE